MDAKARNADPRPNRDRFARWRIPVICAALVLAVGAVFGQTIHHEFVNIDDAVVIQQNPLVVHGLTWQSVAQAFREPHSGNWIPLTWISHMIDWEVFGGDAGGHHLTNVLLHAATTVLLFLALRRMTGATWPSALTAAIFAIHPLRAESIAWVTERRDLLSGLFFMLTLAAYAGYAQRPFSPWRYALVVVAFALGLLAKPMLVTAPLVLLLLDYWPLGRLREGERRRGGEGEMSTPRLAVESPPRPLSASPSLRISPRILWEKIPLLALAACDGWMTLSVQGTELLSGQTISLPWRIGNALISYMRYVNHFFCPWGLALEPRETRPCAPWDVALAAAILMGITAAVVLPVVWGFLSARRSRRETTVDSRLSLRESSARFPERNAAAAARQRMRRLSRALENRPYLAVGWLWYLIMLLPVIGVLQVGIGNAADRFTYLPQIGLAMALVWGGFDLCQALPRRQQRCAGAAALAILAALGVGAWSQTYFWHDSVTLWSHALECNAENWLAHNSLGMALADRGQWQPALEHFRECLRIEPRYLDARVNAAGALAALGRADEAAAEYRAALQATPTSPKACLALGNFLLADGRPDAAIAYYRRALQIDPHYAPALNNLADVFREQGRDDDAITQYEQALRLDPSLVPAHCSLGTILARRGRIDEAVEHYEQALKVNAEDAPTHYYLALALVKRGRLEAAVTHFRRTAELDPGFAENYDELGRVLEAQGRTDQAAAAYRQALAAHRDSLHALNDLAWLLATSPNPSLHNPPEAVELARRANDLSAGRRPEVLDTLAAAFAEAGRFGEAVATGQKALELARQKGPAALAGLLQARIALYQARGRISQARPSDDLRRPWRSDVLDNGSGAGGQ
jgi:tetratricopeptide (TPR) repeat protein